MRYVTTTCTVSRACSSPASFTPIAVRRIPHSCDAPRMAKPACHACVRGTKQHILMFSHVVIFWTKPENPDSAAELLAGAEKYLRPIPGVRSFHIGSMAASHRSVVDQTYQVALNLIFDTKQQQDVYQVHPLHLEFVEKVFKPCCARAVVYDFE